MSLLVFSFLVACGESPPHALTSTTATVLPVTPLPDTTIPIGDLLGKINPAADPRFVKVGAPYTAREGMYLRKETFEAFKKMYEAAAKEGIKLTILSSTRTFEQQTAIWNGKWQRFAAQTPDPEKRARRILEYSSMPGASRHHWGTDIDLNDLNNPAFAEGGKYKKVYDWLTANAAAYGFGQPYTAGRSEGYFEERWHWSYLPLARPFLQAYNAAMTDEQFAGFQGAALAPALGIVANFVNGINPACK